MTETEGTGRMDEATRPPGVFLDADKARELANAWETPCKRKHI